MRRRHCRAGVTLASERLIAPEAAISQVSQSNKDARKDTPEPIRPNQPNVTRKIRGKFPVFVLSMQVVRSINGVAKNSWYCLGRFDDVQASTASDEHLVFHSLKTTLKIPCTSAVNQRKHLIQQAKAPSRMGSLFWMLRIGHCARRDGQQKKAGSPKFRQADLPLLESHSLKRTDN